MIFNRLCLCALALYKLATEVTNNDSTVKNTICNRRVLTSHRSSHFKHVFHHLISLSMVSTSPYYITVITTTGYYLESIYRSPCSTLHHCSISTDDDVEATSRLDFNLEHSSFNLYLIVPVIFHFLY